MRQNLEQTDMSRSDENFFLHFFYHFTRDFRESSALLILCSSLTSSRVCLILIISDNFSSITKIMKTFIFTCFIQLLACQEVKTVSRKPGSFHVRMIFVVDPILTAKYGENVTTQLVKAYQKVQYYHGVQFHLLDIINSNGNNIDINENKLKRDFPQELDWIKMFLNYQSYWWEQSLEDYKNMSVRERLVNANLIIYFHDKISENVKNSNDIFNRTEVWSSKKVDQILSCLDNSTTDDCSSIYDKTYRINVCKDRLFAFLAFDNIAEKLSKVFVELLLDNHADPNCFCVEDADDKNLTCSYTGLVRHKDNCTLESVLPQRSCFLDVSPETLLWDRLGMIINYSKLRILQKNYPVTDHRVEMDESN